MIARKVDSGVVAKVNCFLNPAVYTTGQFVTVSGTVVGSDSRAIANDPDSYPPFVAVDDYYLWPEPQRTATGYHFHSCSDSSSPYPWFQFGYGQLFKQCSR